ISANFNDSGGALAKAEEQYALAWRQMATTYANIAGRQKTPEDKALANAQASNAAAQAQLARSQSNLLLAKTPLEFQTAQAELLKAQNDATRVSAETQQLIPAQSANLNASANEANQRANVLTPA